MSQSSQSKRRGLPIAAHLTLLVTLAVSAAFVAALAIVLLLPPRPPDAMRADQLIDDFATAHAAAVANQPLSQDGALTFAIEAASPPLPIDGGGPVRARLAQTLKLSPDNVRVAAKEERRGNVIVRVQTSEQSIAVVTSDGIKTVTRRIDVDPFAPSPPPPRREPERPPGAVGPPPLLPPVPPEPPLPPMFAPGPHGVLLLSGFVFSAKLPDGRWLVMRQGRSEDLAWIVRTAAAFAATLAILGLIGWLVARRLAQPIQAFARSVGSVGIDPHHAPVDLSGPRELQDAASAINTMQLRLRSLIADRTKTLATVAHDMRTPLMRMRLTADTAQPDVRDRLNRDIDAVEALVASFIAFARDDPAEEKRTRLDLAALLDSAVTDHADAGRPVRYHGPDRLVITGQPLGLKRVFDNLIDNGVKYGTSVDLTLTSHDGVAIIDVLDAGPGVPAHLHDEIFKPFVRATQATSGAGLGLAAARGIVRAHGGDIVVTPSTGGACFRVTLPT